MDKLLKLAVEAHGGLGAWNRLRTLKANVSIGGALWDLKNLTGLFQNTRVDVKLHHQEVVTHLPELNEKIRFVPHQVSLESEDGNALETRDDPRLAFAGHTQDRPWDKLHAGYFSSYALWGYLTAPFLYTNPGFEAEEVAPWRGKRRAMACSEGDFSRGVRGTYANELLVLRGRWASETSPLSR